MILMKTHTVKAIEKSQNFMLKVISNKLNNGILSSVSQPQAVDGNYIQLISYVKINMEMKLI